MRVDEALAAVPAAADPIEVERWADVALGRLGELTLPAGGPSAFPPLDAIEAAGLAGDRLTRLANAAFLADWACYGAAADRVDLGRLHAVMAGFPAGFRVWFHRSADGTCLPVGYTGWYPIDAETFDRVCDRPGSVASRGELRPARAVEAAPCLWLFNYSIVAPLRRSAHSRLMLGRYAEDLGRVPHRGLAAAVLSEGGRRVASRFGMTFRGQMRHDGVPEDVYARVR